MKQASFLLPTLVSPISPMISLVCVLFFSFLATKSLGAVVDPRFLACSVPKACGDGQNITFPFYIRQDTQEKYYCGHRGFQISCNQNGQPTIIMGDINYTIHKIFYQNQTLRVSNATFSNSNTGCIPLIKNIPSSLVRFELVPKQSNLSLFYNCSNSSLLHSDDLQSYAGCDGENVVALSEDDPKLGNVSKECTTRVVAPVEAYGGESDGIRGALENGFWLKWKATNCSSCENSGGFCGFMFDDDNINYRSQCFCADRPHYVSCNNPVAEPRRNKTKLPIALATLSAGIGVVMIVICCYFWRKFSFNKTIYFWTKETLNHQTSVEVFLRNHGPIAIRRYNYSDIKKMTNFFRDKLGEGGYGCVYKGKLQDGCFVAVKILKESRGNGEQFINEVASISRTSHVNIVSLMGFCFEGSKRALIYEFMSNGSLDKFIYKKSPSRADRRLEWETLYKIALGIAQGLEYLHKGCNTRILHFDIKPHNILLDENFCPKISDFGLAKICPREKSIISMLGARGTIGYIAPELFCRNFGGVSHKSDVYSYGMMVFEMVGGRRNIDVEIDRTSEIFFPHWIYKRLEQDEDLGLQGLMNEVDHESARKMIIVSLWCIQTDPSIRPSMSRVVNMLEGSLESLQVPPKPYLSSPSRSPKDYSTTMSSLQYDPVMP